MKTDAELGGPWSDSLPDEIPVVHRDLVITIGARHLTTMSRDHLHYWMNNLRYMYRGPFITISRSGAEPFIQTYRNSADDYTLEVHPRTRPGDYRVHYIQLPDADQVEQLLWDWLQNDWQRLDALDWTHGTV